MVSLFLEQTGVLKAHNKIELFSFHTSNLMLIKLLLVGLLLEFTFNLRPSVVLSVNKIHLTLLLGFLLLVFDHHFDVLGFLLLNAAVILPLLPVLHLFGLGLICIKLRLG
jgi:hypothetical protein